MQPANMTLQNKNGTTQKVDGRSTLTNHQIAPICRRGPVATHRNCQDLHIQRQWRCSRPGPCFMPRNKAGVKCGMFWWRLGEFLSEWIHICLCGTTFLLGFSVDVDVPRCSNREMMVNPHVHHSSPQVCPLLPTCVPSHVALKTPMFTLQHQFLSSKSPRSLLQSQLVHPESIFFMRQKSVFLTYVYIYIYVCVCVCVCMYIYIYIYIYIYS